MMKCLLAVSALRPVGQRTTVTVDRLGRLAMDRLLLLQLLVCVLGLEVDSRRCHGIRLRSARQPSV